MHAGAVFTTISTNQISKILCYRLLIAAFCHHLALCAFLIGAIGDGLDAVGEFSEAIGFWLGSPT
jgi:hypothetical protein